MSDSKTLDKVRHLIALASSTSEEEARTSAVLACRLISEHKFLVVLSNGATPSPNGSPSRPDKTKWTPPRRSPRPERPEPKPRPAASAKRRPGNAKPRLIIINYRGVCATCGNYVTHGSRAWWRPGQGIAHEECSYDSLY